MGYLLRIDSPAAHARRVVYVSRAGFYVSTDPTDWGGDIISRYYHLVTRPWYTGQSERENRARSVRWFTHGADDRTVTAAYRSITNATGTARWR